MVVASRSAAATGALAIAPFTSRPSHLPAVSTETRLIDASDSILNIPANLFYDVVNIPANEVQGLDTAADSLFYNDNIFVTSRCLREWCPTPPWQSSAAWIPI